MSFSMYEASIPLLLRGLNNLAGILAKGAAHAAAHNIEPSALLTARLFPDMFALTRQVQIVSDTAKGAGARLAGVDVPNYADTEASFDELQARVAATVAFLASLTAAQFEGSETRVIKIPTRSRGELEFTGASYLQTFALPNFYFHISTAYGILRHSGVVLGKLDYLGAA